MIPTDPEAYEWPEPCRASLLAQLAATSAADEAARWARLLPRRAVVHDRALHVDQDSFWYAVGCPRCESEVAS